MRVHVRDGFAVLLTALWCADTSGVLPLVLLAAAVHELGHIAVLYAAGGRVHTLELTACGAVLRCALPEGRYARAAVWLAGPAASFALTALAQSGGAYRLAGASALLGLFNLLPVPPLDGGMALTHLAAGRFPRVRCALAAVCALFLLGAGAALARCGCGLWLLLIGTVITAKLAKSLAKPAFLV